MMFWDHSDQFSWWYIFMPLSMMAFWGLVAWVIVILVRGDRRSDHPQDTAATPSGPDHILAERYARGEIDSEEYQRRLDTLHTHSGAAHSPTG